MRLVITVSGVNFLSLVQEDRVPNIIYDLVSVCCDWWQHAASRKHLISESATQHARRRRHQTRPDAGRERERERSPTAARDAASLRVDNDVPACVTSCVCACVRDPDEENSSAGSGSLHRSKHRPPRRCPYMQASWSVPQVLADSQDLLAEGIGLCALVHVLFVCLYVCACSIGVTSTSSAHSCVGEWASVGADSSLSAPFPPCECCRRLLVFNSSFAGAPSVCCGRAETNRASIIVRDPCYLPQSCLQSLAHVCTPLLYM